MANAFRMEKIDIARFLSLAGRRGVKDEIQSIVKVLVVLVRWVLEVTCQMLYTFLPCFFLR